MTKQQELAGSLDLIYENLKSKINVADSIAANSLPRNHRVYANNGKYKAKKRERKHERQK